MGGQNRILGVGGYEPKEGEKPSILIARGELFKAFDRNAPQFLERLHQYCWHEFVDFVFAWVNIPIKPKKLDDMTWQRIRERQRALGRGEELMPEGQRQLDLDLVQLNLYADEPLDLEYKTSWLKVFTQNYWQPAKFSPEFGLLFSDKFGWEALQTVCAEAKGQLAGTHARRLAKAINSWAGKCELKEDYTAGR